VDLGTVSAAAANGWTPLHDAAKRGYEVLDLGLLVDRVADILAAYRCG
jgi:hypothetical protein